MKKILVLFMALVMVSINTISIHAEEQPVVTTTAEPAMTLTAEAAIVMEPESGKIIFEKNSHKQLYPASVTKIMTLLLIFEALDAGKIKPEDVVTTSEYAASMGGSQVWLEAGETQTVETLIKCISIASANDCAVAMAEFIGGSEEGFVQKMNQRAKELGMLDTTFKNACGLDDNVEGHVTSAYDIAVMSRELIIKHPEVFKYSTTWMDSITHVTKKGESEFGLTNTNKLINSYHGITGLKTGTTSKAKHCLSATAKRNDMQMIAVVLAVPVGAIRFQEAARLLDYGFANCTLYKDLATQLPLDAVKVKSGTKSVVNGEVIKDFSYACVVSENPDDIKKVIEMQNNLVAPIAKGTIIGKIVYSLNGKTIGVLEIYAKEDIIKATYKFYFNKVMKLFSK
ncbi:MAG: Serine-type D-Ala-D-Ala carboxypeptidase [Clostridiales bacterium]|jgi:D-alanyl-D-alanine carboxypeptidase (penicillin-binding protein 5/6)|nr:Serine-type D-Ala-D-Ala carboxypeptidase [Clostridiales bacterium]